MLPDPRRKGIVLRLVLISVFMTEISAAQPSDPSWLQLTPYISRYHISFAGVERDMRTATSYLSQVPVPYAGFGTDYAYGFNMTIPLRGSLRIGCGLQFFPTRGNETNYRQDSTTYAVFDNRYMADVLMFQLMVDIPQLVALWEGSLGLRLAGGPALINFRKEFDATVTTTTFPLPGTYNVILQGNYKVTVPQAEIVFTLRYPIFAAVSISGHFGWTTTRVQTKRGSFNLDPIFNEEARAQSPFMQDVELGFRGTFGGAGLELRF